MKKRIIAILMLCCLIAAMSVPFSSFADDENDPIPDPDAFGFYEEATKACSTFYATDMNGLPVEVTYSFTENLLSTALSDRSDVYGTYDVYADESGAEYTFLYNTQLLCGYLSYDFAQIEDEDRIEEADARDIADAFLASRVTQTADYSLTDSYYEDSSEQFYYEYSYYADGYKTDDAFKLWLDAAGGLISFAEFYRNRYSNVSISSSDYEAAEAVVDAEIAMDARYHAIMDEYVTINDDGELCIVKLVEIAIPTINGDIYEAVEYSAVIE